MDFSASYLVDLIGTRAYFAIRERQRKISRKHALQRDDVCLKKCFARVALELQHFLLSRRLGKAELARQNSYENNKRRSFHIVSECAYYRLSSQIQFVSQVLPPSAEKDCSIRADFGEIFNQT